MAETFDTIIVGAGSSGCVLANRLSADPKRRVLVLEAGGHDSRFWSRIPIGYYRLMNDPKYARTFMTEPSEGTNGRTIGWPRGRMLGGSSSINGLIFIRGQHEDFDDWETLGAEGWSYRDVLPYFRKLEKSDRGESQFRGTMGNLEVSQLRNENEANEAWLAAAQEYGLPLNDDFNGATTAGAGKYDLSIGSRWRSSSSRAFLHPAKARRNLTIQTGALAGRVVFDGQRAIGVEWTGPQGKQTTHADQIVLCGGALQSPQMLQLSGVGPADLLTGLGIPVVHDAPGVGENLHDHYQIRSIVRMNRRLSLNDKVRSPFQLAKMGLEWLLTGSGPLTVGAGQVGAAVATKHAVNGRPDIQLLAMPLSVDKSGEPLHRYSGFTTVAWQCHPESRGTLQIASADPTESPRIQPNYLSAEMDRKVMTEGVKIMREIHNQPAFARITDAEVIPGEATQTDEQILECVRNNAGTVFHPVGTCRMGTGAKAVVSAGLAVHGVENLYVADASVMPKITSANTNAPCLMIGEKAAAHILGEV